MSAPKATEQSQDADNRPGRNQADNRPSRHQAPNLDRRYGEIGISAVAAAVRCRPAQIKRQAAHGDGRYDYD
jgi:hypothetical protein